MSQDTTFKDLFPHLWYTAPLIMDDCIPHDRKGSEWVQPWLNQVRKVPVEDHTAEWQRAEQELHRSLPNAQLLKLERVQSRSLWLEYRCLHLPHALGCVCINSVHGHSRHALYQTRVWNLVWFRTSRAGGMCRMYGAD